MTFEAQADFDERLLPQIRARPVFRLVTDEEVTRSFAAYRRGDIATLCDEWRSFASPTRADLGPYAPFYERANILPSIWNGLAFLASVRAVLAAGRGFRSRLKPETRRALATEFPWLERRHEHIPPGWTPLLEFPAEMRAFVDGGTLDDARARWQLMAALNEVQQSAYSSSLVRQFALPELSEHASRERALAINYFAHSSPDCSEALWRQCIIVLDALNAAVFAMMCRDRPRQMIAHSVKRTFSGRGEWRAFVDGLKRPQWLMPLDIA
jgi:hypothetical protein